MLFQSVHHAGYFFHAVSVCVGFLTVRNGGIPHRIEVDDSLARSAPKRATEEVLQIGVGRLGELSVFGDLSEQAVYVCDSYLPEFHVPKVGLNEFVGISISPERGRLELLTASALTAFEKGLKIIVQT